MDNQTTLDPVSQHAVALSGTPISTVYGAAHTISKIARIETRSNLVRTAISRVRRRPGATLDGKPAPTIDHSAGAAAE